MYHSRIRQQGTIEGTGSVVAVAVAVVVAVAVAVAAAYVSSTKMTSCCCVIRLVPLPIVVGFVPGPMPPKDQTIPVVVDQSAAATVAAAAAGGSAVVAVEIGCEGSGSGFGFGLGTAGNYATCPDFVPAMPPDLKIPAGRAYPVHPQTTDFAAADAVGAAATVQAVEAAELGVPS